MGIPGGRSTVEPSGTFAVTARPGDIIAQADDGSRVVAATAGMFAGMLPLVALGALVMTAEYRRRLVRTIPAASPRRGPVLAAKAVVTGGACFAAALVATAAALLLAQPLLRRNGYRPPTSLTRRSDPRVLRVVAGVAVAAALVALLSLGLGTILRLGAAAITAVAAVLLVPAARSTPSRRSCAPVPATACLPPLAVVATAALGAAVSTSCAADCDSARVSLSGVYLGQLAVAALAVLASAGEYRHGLAATTLLAMPARPVAYAAKALVVTAAVLPAAVLAVTASLAGTPLATPSLRAGGGTVVCLVLVVLRAFGVAATLRRTAAALSTVLGCSTRPPITAQFVIDERWRTWIERAAPMPDGLGAVAAWAAAALTAGALTLTLRNA